MAYYCSVSMRETIVYIFFPTRLSSPDDQAILTDEAVLCVTSCLRILKAVSKSYCDFPLLLECLHNIEASISLLDKRSFFEQDKRKTFEKMKQMVVDSFQFAKKWCEKKLNSKIPCYNVKEAENELKVCTLLS